MAKQPAQLDLGRHAVVEASAGTGKTHKLETLVRDLLQAGKACLEQILLVTFTEKATGELKGRLRANLERARNELPESRAVFQAALDEFDQAPIYTIHGFCQYVLQEYAFEHGQDFRPELADDSLLLRRCLRDIQRSDWPRDYGKRLRTVLEQAGYQEKGGASWEKTVLSVAGRYRPAFGNLLLPDAGKECKEKVPDEEQRGRFIARTVCQLQDHLARCKSERGLRSFDDMLVQMFEGLDPERNPAAEHLLARLRSRFRYAIVDEFQDTDPLQWQIFKRIFVEGGESRLFIVGDPKQAIFSFRGADLPTYQQAVTELIRDHAAVAEQLPVNWRSVPELLKPLNQLFSDSDWFASSNISYHPVEPPEECLRRNKIVKDESGRPALTLLDFTEAKRLTEARRRNAHFIAAEIQRLLGGAIRARSVSEGGAIRARSVSEGGLSEGGPGEGQPPSLVHAAGSEKRPPSAESSQAVNPSDDRHGRIDNPSYNTMELIVKGQASRPLQAGDIGVLVFKHGETRPLVKAFRKAGIPFSYYKQRGLWQADEVTHLDFVLRALAHPEDSPKFHRALLTRFFRATPQDLARCDELPASHRARKLFNDWLGMVERRAWSSLFRSLLEDTGLVVREAADLEEGERRLANLRHIIGVLEQAAYERNLDLLAILELLEERRRSASDDADLQPIETERSKVRIMTVHASKGLEFPIVFLAGGFTSGPGGEYVTYRDDRGHVVLDLRKEEDGKDKAKEERWQEERRLLYVALTRAMFKLYLPVVNGTRSPGPLVRILQPALAQSQIDDLGSPWTETITPREKPLRPASAGMSQAGSPEPGPRLELPSELFPRIDPDLKRRRIGIRSFSSLHRARVARQAEEPSYVERPPRADDDKPGALDVPDPLRGPVFGDMVHNVLETVDFALIGAAADPMQLLVPGSPVRKLIDQEVNRSVLKLQSRLRGDALEEACRTQVAELIWKTLRTPLKELGGPLTTIPPKDRVQELEFHFPEDSGNAPPAEVRREEGFLTGFMDMVFRNDGRYFLLDWKTNWLDAYDPESLAQCMEESDYIRQYRLYLQALARWLSKIHPDFDFGRNFGGVYYLFLRGMNGLDETSGVFFARAGGEDLVLESVLALG